MTFNAAELALSIYRAHLERMEFGASTLGLPVSTVDEAYRIQREYVELLSERLGTRAGYKIGLTSLAMQRMCGIDTPIAGVLLSRRVFPSQADIALSDHVRPGLEFEIAVRIGRNPVAGGATYSRADIARAVDGVAPAFEIVDDRNADYDQLDARALIADNGWNAGAVLGRFITDWPELSAIRGVVELNGDVIAEGNGGDIMGHPLEPVAWLANELARRGVSLQPGEIVLTGSLVRTRFISPGECYRLAIEGLGAVEVSFGA